jgi:hypothetical protein
MWKVAGGCAMKGRRVSQRVRGGRGEGENRAQPSEKLDAHLLMAKTRT